MRLKYVYPRINCLNMSDTIGKPTFMYALEQGCIDKKNIWVSIPALVDEHVIDYDFMTYRMAISTELEECALLSIMLPQIKKSALQSGYIVRSISTDLNWSQSGIKKRIIPGVNMHGVFSVGILAKDPDSAELLEVQNI